MNGALRGACIFPASRTEYHLIAEAAVSSDSSLFPQNICASQPVLLLVVISARYSGSTNIFRVIAVADSADLQSVLLIKDLFSERQTYSHKPEFEAPRDRLSGSVALVCPALNLLHCTRHQKLSELRSREQYG